MSRMSSSSSLFPLLFLITTCLLLASTSIASAVPTDPASTPSYLHQLEKRDPSYVPANIALEGCSVKDRNFATYAHNDRIQMGECYMNARIMNQAFAWFEPYDDPSLAMEGGVYGTCYATSKFPKSDNLISVKNVNYACFLWTEKGLGEIPKLTGKEMIPFPTVCPMNLENCYSHGVYNPGHLMGIWNDTVPTFSGQWKSPKGKNHQFFWCDHIQPNCPTPSNFDLQLENIAKMKCNVTNCPPYGGVTAKLDDATRARSTNTGLKPGPSYRIVKGKMVTNAPETQVGYKPGRAAKNGTVPGPDLPPVVSGDGTKKKVSSSKKHGGSTREHDGGSDKQVKERDLSKVANTRGTLPLDGGKASAASIKGVSDEKVECEGEVDGSDGAGSKAAGGRRDVEERSHGEMDAETMLPRSHRLKNLHKRRHI